MMTHFDHRVRTAIVLLAFLVPFSLWFVTPNAGAAQGVHGFTVTVDPLVSCQSNTPITGTVALIGLTSGYDFYVDLRGDGEILDGQAFEGHDGYPDGTYEWSVTGDSGGAQDVLELDFALHGSEGQVIRDETLALNPDCAQFPTEASGTPGQPLSSPVTVSSLPGDATASPPPRPSPVSDTRSLSAAGAGEESRTDVRMVFGLTAATVIVLSALAVLDRRPEP